MNAIDYVNAILEANQELREKYQKELDSCIYLERLIAINDFLCLIAEKLIAKTRV